MSYSITPLSFPAFLASLKDGAVLFDTRTPVEFINSFVPGSVYVGPQELNWKVALSLFNKDIPVIMIFSESAKEDAQLPGKLFGNLIGYLKGGFASYMESDNEIDLLIDIEPDEFAMDIPFDTNMLILDVREPDDFEKEHVKTALNIPLSDMGDIAQIAGLEEDQNIYLYGENEAESLMATSLLKRQGYSNIRFVRGGWQQIKSEPSIALKKPTKTLEKE